MSNSTQQKSSQDSEQPDQHLRLNCIIGPNGLLPFSRSTFYSYVSKGLIKKPTKLGPRISVWKKSDILAFIERMEAAND